MAWKAKVLEVVLTVTAWILRLEVRVTDPVTITSDGEVARKTGNGSSSDTAL